MNHRNKSLKSTSNRVSITKEMVNNKLNIIRILEKVFNIKIVFILILNFS